MNNKSQNYTDLLIKKQLVWWKRLIDVQLPYRLNLKALNPGFTLDIGCGIGRNLINLKGNGIGIDTDKQSVEVAKSRGIRAFTPEEFKSSLFNKPGNFDSILLAHVAEHMTKVAVMELLSGYYYLLKPDGKLIIITPQEAGYGSDPTHVELMDFIKIRDIVKRTGFEVYREYSFPFPRPFGRLFKYNEFVSVAARGKVNCHE